MSTSRISRCFVFALAPTVPPSAFAHVPYVELKDFRRRLFLVGRAPESRRSTWMSMPSFYREVKKGTGTFFVLLEKGTCPLFLRAEASSVLQSLA